MYVNKYAAPALELVMSSMGNSSMEHVTKHSSGVESFRESLDALKASLTRVKLMKAVSVDNTGSFTCGYQRRGCQKHSPLQRRHECSSASLPQHTEDEVLSDIVSIQSLA